jgi:hypothetical protein
MLSTTLLLAFVLQLGMKKLEANVVEFQAEQMRARAWGLIGRIVLLDIVEQPSLLGSFAGLSLGKEIPRCCFLDQVGNYKIKQPKLIMRYVNSLLL